MLTLIATCHYGAGEMGGPLPRYEVRPAVDWVDAEPLLSFDCYGSEQSQVIERMFGLMVEAGEAVWHKTMRPRNNVDEVEP